MIGMFHLWVFVSITFLLGAVFHMNRRLKKIEAGPYVYVGRTAFGDGASHPDVEEFMKEVRDDVRTL